MVWLNIFSNETFLLVAETLIIVIGSMLLGILLCYINSWGLKSKFTDLRAAIDEEQKQSAALRDQVQDLTQIRAQLQEEYVAHDQKLADQARTIYDQQLIIRNREQEYLMQKNAVDDLKAKIDIYENRLDIIQQELESVAIKKVKPKKETQIAPVRVNFEHVSQLLGKQVTENDLTLIIGIGPKTASLLQSKGVDTWEDLAATPLLAVSKWLIEAGGVYKAQDPTHWAKQAKMAMHGEWRKLRVFQETLRKKDA